MTNFDFLKTTPDFASFADVAISAENLLHIDVDACVLNCRRAMEFAVKWMYSVDRELSMPYQDNLVSLMNDEKFRDIIGTDIWRRMEFIRKIGNNAAHGGKKANSLPPGKKHRSRGNDRRAVMVRHVLKNALIPVITFLAVSAAEIMTGSIIIEQVFAIPGVSRLLLASISSRDFPVVQAIVVILAAWIVIINFVADLLYQLVDPRIRLK